MTRTNRVLAAASLAAIAACAGEEAEEAEADEIIVTGNEVQVGQEADYLLAAEPDDSDLPEAGVLPSTPTTQLEAGKTQRGPSFSADVDIGTAFNPNRDAQLLPRMAPRSY